MNHYWDYVLRNPPIDVYRLILSKMFSRGKRLCAFDDSHPCIFVLSTGRVGSQTLAEILSLSRNVISLHEPSPLLYRMSKVAYQRKQLGNCDYILDESFRSLRSDLLSRALLGGTGYVETSPQSTFLADVIARVVPGVKFIHLIRHPAEVIRSAMRRGWYVGHPCDETRIIPHEDLDMAHRWKLMTPFQKNAWLWNETNQWIVDFSRGNLNDRFFTLRSEDLYAGKANILASLFRFVGSTMPDERMIDRVLSRRLNRQRSGDYPEYINWSPDAINDLEKYAGKMAREFGFLLATDKLLSA